MSTKTVSGENLHKGKKTQDIALALAQTITCRIIWHWWEATASLYRELISHWPRLVQMLLQDSCLGEPDEHDKKGRQNREK